MSEPIHLKDADGDGIAVTSEADQLRASGPPAIRNSVPLACIDDAKATELARRVAGETGAPASVDGAVVTLPGDQPGFLFHVLEVAVNEGYAYDHDVEDTIRTMEAGLR